MTPEFTTDALENIEETGADWERDLERLRSGEMTEQSLLEYCLEGADADREQGWREYVETLVAMGPARDLDDEAACRGDHLYELAREERARELQGGD